MKKDFSLAFCSTLDSKNEHLIYVINKNLSLGYAPATHKVYYGNITVSSKKLLETYLEIKHIITANLKFRVEHVSIFDFGCGIGNVLEMFALLFKNDAIAAPNLKTIKLGGIDRISAYVDIAKPILENLTPYVRLRVGDFASNPSNSTVNASREFYIQTMESMEDQIEKGNTANIIYVNRPLRDLDAEITLEKFIINTAPVGSFICFPMGCKTVPKKGVRVYSINLLRKTHIHVSY